MNDEVKFMTIDAKGRMMVPKNSILGKSENILIARENDITFSLHDLIVFNGYIEKLKIKREKAIIIPLKYTLNKKSQNMVKFI